MLVSQRTKQGKEQVEKETGGDKEKYPACILNK